MLPELGEKVPPSLGAKLKGGRQKLVGHPAPNADSESGENEAVLMGLFRPESSEDTASTPTSHPQCWHGAGRAGLDGQGRVEAKHPESNS